MLVVLGSNVFVATVSNTGFSVMCTVLHLRSTGWSNNIIALCTTGLSETQAHNSLGVTQCSFSSTLTDMFTFAACRHGASSHGLFMSLRSWWIHRLLPPCKQRRNYSHVYLSLGHRECTERMWPFISCRDLRGSHPFYPPFHRGASGPTTDAERHLGRFSSPAWQKLLSFNCHI